jgi:hypothetical protein
MPLPKLKHPIYELTLPSNNKVVKYRPFLVREEKILLMAKQSEDPAEIIRAIKQVINNCIVDPDNLNVDELATFDIEYFFLKLRSKSVNNVVSLSFKDFEDEKVYDVDVDLDKVEMKSTEGHTNRIKAGEDMGIIMRYPSVEIYSKLDLKDEEKLALEAVAWCIDSVYDSEQVYKRGDFTEAELIEFLEDLDLDILQEIVKFFQTMPKLYYKVTYTNSKGNVRVVELDSLTDFFTLG